MWNCRGVGCKLEYSYSQHSDHCPGAAFRWNTRHCHGYQPPRCSPATSYFYTPIWSSTFSHQHPLIWFNMPNIKQQHDAWLGAICVLSTCQWQCCKSKILLYLYVHMFQLRYSAPPPVSAAAAAHLSGAPTHFFNLLLPLKYLPNWSNFTQSQQYLKNN